MSDFLFTMENLLILFWELFKQTSLLLIDFIVSPVGIATTVLILGYVGYRRLSGVQTE